MTILSLYTAVNPCEKDGRWSCEPGTLQKKFQCFADFEKMPFFQRKKTLLSAVKAVDDGDYDVRGRNGRYSLCEKKSGIPVWCVCVE